MQLRPREPLQEVADSLGIEPEAELFGRCFFDPFTHKLWRQLGERDLLGADQPVFLALVHADVQSAGKSHGNEPGHLHEVQSHGIQAIASDNVHLRVVLLKPTSSEVR